MHIFILVRVSDLVITAKIETTKYEHDRHTSKIDIKEVTNSNGSINCQE